MKVGEAYLKTLQKVNKNLTNDNVSLDRARFVLLFNEMSGKFLEWILEKRNEDDIRDVQKLLVTDVLLKKQGRKLNQINFELPKNYFSFSNIQVFASKNKCKDKKLQVFEVKSENTEELLADEFNKPSFKYRETFYKVASDTVNIYVDEFDINKVYLTYYRYIKGIDIEGYIRPDGTQSSNIDPELDDRIVNRIISAVAKEFNLNNDNLQKYQFDRDRIFSKI